jgi:hypothetical protein
LLTAFLWRIYFLYVGCLFRDTQHW